MDDVLTIFTSWQFVIFGLGIAAIVFVFRTVIEYLLVNTKIISHTSKLWRDLILPILPVIMGVFLSVSVSDYPYPDGISNVQSRFIFGLVAGLLSSLLYRLIKSLINKKLLLSKEKSTEDE